MKKIDLSKIKPLVVSVLEYADWWLYNSDKGLFMFLCRIRDTPFPFLYYYRKIFPVLGHFSENREKWRELFKEVVAQAVSPGLSRAYQKVLEDAWHKVVRIMLLIETIARAEEDGEAYEVEMPPFTVKVKGLDVDFVWWRE